MENELENINSQNDELEGSQADENPTETIEEDANSVEETIEPTLEEKVQELELKNKQLYARVKKAEKPTNKTNQEQTLPTDEIVFIAQGGTQEELTSIKDYAKLKNISFKEALDSNVVKAIREDVKAQAKKEAAQLDPSTGSPTQRKKTTGNMSEDEHKDAFFAAVDKLG